MWWLLTFGATDKQIALRRWKRTIFFQLTGDIVGLVRAFGEESAVIVGHDWGALVAAYAALSGPTYFAQSDCKRPYAPRGSMNQSEWEQKKYPGKISTRRLSEVPGQINS